MIVFTILGVLFAMVIILNIGCYFGKQLTVDHTKRDGFFRTYGKKYIAIPSHPHTSLILKLCENIYGMNEFKKSIEVAELIGESFIRIARMPDGNITIKYLPNKDIVLKSGRD